MKNQTEYVDTTPTWEETAVMLVAIMEGTGDTAWARSEIVRMGKIIEILMTMAALLNMPLLLKANRSNQ